MRSLGGHTLHLIASPMQVFFMVATIVHLPSHSAPAATSLDGEFSPSVGELTFQSSSGERTLFFVHNLPRVKLGTTMVLPDSKWSPVFMEPPDRAHASRLLRPPDVPQSYAEETHAPASLTRVTVIVPTGPPPRAVGSCYMKSSEASAKGCHSLGTTDSSTTSKKAGSSLLMVGETSRQPLGPLGSYDRVRASPTSGLHVPTFYRTRSTRPMPGASSDTRPLAGD